MVYWIWNLPYPYCMVDRQFSGYLGGSQAREQGGNDKRGIEVA